MGTTHRINNVAQAFGVRDWRCKILDETCHFLKSYAMYSCLLESKYAPDIPTSTPPMTTFSSSSPRYASQRHPHFPPYSSPSSTP